MQSYNYSYPVYSYGMYYSGGWSTLPSNQPSKGRVLTVVTQVNGNRKAPNAQRYRKYTYTNGVGRLDCRYTGSNAYNSFYNVGLIVNAYVDSTLDGVLQAAAYNHALSSLNDSVRGSLDLSIDSFQGQQTSRMVRSAMNLVGVAREFRKTLITKNRSITWRTQSRYIGGKWLEYQYGWKPLCQSIYDAASLIVNPNGRQWEIALHGRGSATAVLRGTHSDGMCSGPSKTDRSVRCEIGVVLKPPTSRLQKLAQFTSLNPASIAWELLPYSFVVDWLYNIGGYIRNAETAFLYNSTFVSGYVTYSHKNTAMWTPYGVSNSTRNVVYSGNTPHSEFTEKIRTVLSSYPLPRKPVLRPELGATRLLNAAALLSQFLKGR